MLNPKIQYTIVSINSVLILALLQGCSGGETPPVQQPELTCCEPLDSSAATTSRFAGVGIRTGSDGTLALSVGDGLLTHNTGAIEYGDSNYTLIDPDGFNAGVSSDGLSGILEHKDDVFSGSYDYVIPIVFSYNFNGESFTTTGFAGILTSSEMVPAIGNATYIGEAAGSIATSDGFYDLSGGTSTILVDFGAGVVDLTMNDFTSINAPIDTVQITGMTISGSTFAGGDLTTFLEGAAIDVTGNSTIISSDGMFFGFDEALGTPDEIAGALVAIGDDGFLLFTYVGD